VRVALRLEPEEDLHLALEDEEHLLDLVAVAALPCPGGTNITLRVKCSAGIARTSVFPDAPAPM